MEDRNCELLFEYLRSILYDSEVKTLEIDRLDEPFRNLEWVAVSGNGSKGNETMFCRIIQRRPFQL